MKIVFDGEKERANLAKHRLSLADASGIDFGRAKGFPDDRNDYGEDRIVAFGDINGRLHCVVFVHRNDEIRVISLRKANNREKKKYAQA